MTRSKSGWSTLHTVSLLSLGFMCILAWKNINDQLILPTPKPPTPDKVSKLGAYKPKSKHLTPQFVARVKAIAKNLKTKPEYLLAVMGFETGGTYSPSIQNPLSKATGLIQFVEPTARGLGTSTSALAQMGAVQQLKYVEKHFRPFKGRMNTLADVYAAVLWPIAVGRGGSYVLFRKGSIEYRQNNGLDANRDGFITLAETTIKVKQFLPHPKVLSTK